LKKHLNPDQVPSDEVKFIADVHLGKLAKYLRLCGFDTYFDTTADDRSIIDLSLSQNRIILSRDKELVNNKNVSDSYRIISPRPVEQLISVLERYDLKARIQPFTRCLLCNGDVAHVEKEDIEEHLRPDTRQFFKEFYRCGQCGKIYWEGSHYERMKKFINLLLEKTDDPCLTDCVSRQAGMT
jgi:uncharacterized protein with PIN domain